MIGRNLARTLVCAFTACLLLGGSTFAQTLYVASGSNGVNGTLYTMNPATGVTTPVGPLVDAAGLAYGLTGMAFSPTTGVLYGSTANLSPNSPGFLVTINPATAQVTVIGDIFPGAGGSAADISFGPTGTLYGWQSNGQHTLLNINTATGQGAAIGVGEGVGVFGGGGLAVRWTDGAGFCTPDGNTAVNPTFRSVNLVTGTTAVIGIYGIQQAMVAMDFNNASALYGLVSDNALVTSTTLVTINPATGVATVVAPTTASDLDAMAFQRSIPEPATLGVLGLGLLILGGRRRA